jgi:hypothetical protein
MLQLFTDFGLQGPYVGQLHAAILRAAPGTSIIDLLHDAPMFRPRAAAHLLAACAGESQPGDVFVCVVDPGVGTARRPLALRADGRWFVGPDNGLLEVVAARATEAAWWEITWRPAQLSASFHGRDLFGPVAARIAAGEPTTAWGTPIPAPPGVADPELAEIIYLDAYGNAMTGLRGDRVEYHATLTAGGERLSYRRTFGKAAPGEAFWYVNSLGLVEIAVNRGSAAAQLGLTIGMAVGREA